MAICIAEGCTNTATYRCAGASPTCVEHKSSCCIAMIMPWDEAERLRPGCSAQFDAQAMNGEHEIIALFKNAYDGLTTCWIGADGHVRYAALDPDSDVWTDAT